MRFCARIDQLGFSIAYEFMGVSPHYEPDYLVRLQNGVALVLEIKGMETAQDRANTTPPSAGGMGVPPLQGSTSLGTRDCAFGHHSASIAQVRLLSAGWHPMNATLVGRCPPIG